MRKVSFSSALVGLTAHFGARDGCGFSANHYDIADIEHSRHPHELRRFCQDAPRLRLDWAHHGLVDGGDRARHAAGVHAGRGGVWL